MGATAKKNQENTWNMMNMWSSYKRPWSANSYLLSKWNIGASFSDVPSGRRQEPETPKQPIKEEGMSGGEQNKDLATDPTYPFHLLMLFGMVSMMSKRLTKHSMVCGTQILLDCQQISF